MTERREAIARIVDPETWVVADHIRDGNADGYAVQRNALEVSASLAKADAILALDGGVREALEALVFEVRCNREPNAGPLHAALMRADQALSGDAQGPSHD